MEILAEAGDRSLPPFGVFKKSPLYPKYKDGIARILVYVRETMGAKNRVEERKCLLILFRMLSRWMAGARIPLMLKSVVQQLDRVPALVDRQFPGYRAAGLLPALIKAQRI
jgi:hypothetical protein